MDLSIWSIGGVGDLCRRETERRSRFRLLERRIERQGSSSRLPRSYQNAREAKIHQLGVRAKVIMHCTKSIEQQEGSVAVASTAAILLAAGQSVRFGKEHKIATAVRGKALGRSEESRVSKECVATRRARWWPAVKQKKR